MDLSNLSNLSKQQKDRLLLMVMGGVLLVGGVGYGLKSVFAISASVESKNEILESKISRAERMVRMQNRLLKDTQDISAELKTYIKEAPPEKDYYPWASKLLYALAKETAFEIKDVIDIGGSSSSPKVKGKDKKVKVDVLKIGSNFKVVAEGEYETCLNFLKTMEKEYPLVRVVSVDIKPGENVEIHNVNIVIQWPSNLAYLLREKATTKGVKP